MPSGFTSPNYTQTPNDWFSMLPSMGYAEMKVTAVIIRWTFGYHRRAVGLSLKQLVRLTGLTEGSVIAGAGRGVERGILARSAAGAGDRRRIVWAVVVNGDVAATSLAEVEPDKTTSASEVALPQLVRQTTSASEVHLKKSKQTENKTATTQTAAAAAEDLCTWWDLNLLAAASKLPKVRRLAIANANPSGGAYVAKYLYGLSKPGIDRPAFWAAAQLIDNPGDWEGAPFGTIAELGPAGVARVLAWMRDGCIYPLEIGADLQASDKLIDTGAHLALAGLLKTRWQKQPDRLTAELDGAISDLGLTTMAAAPDGLQFISAERAAPPAPRPALDQWQAAIEAQKNNFNPGMVDRLRRCELVRAEGGRLYVSAPNLLEYTYLQNRMARALAERFSAELVPMGEG